eukprot:20629-Heterococcus_DN1.PRE.1
MARTKAHKDKQAVVQPPASLSLDQLAYLDAGGSPTRQVEVEAPSGKTLMVPLLHAVCLCAHRYHTELAGSVELLTKAGAQVSATCTDFFDNSRTALMWVCDITTCCNSPIDALLAAGADASLASVSDGATAVGLAAMRSRPAAVQALLHHGADPFVLDYKRRGAAQFAAAMGHIPILELIMNHNCAPQQFHSSAPLVAAASYGKLECAEWLLLRGAQINALDSMGFTALHAAAAEDEAECMLQLLLASGADVNACNEDGGDALCILACNRGSAQSAQLLLAAGADVTHTDNQGIGALHFAVANGKTELVQLLLQSGAGVLLNNLYPMTCKCCSDVTSVMASNNY